MSVKKFCWLLNEAKIGKNDKFWFPKWIRSYAAMVLAVGGQETSHNTGAVGGQETAQNTGRETGHGAGDLSVTQAEVIRFLRSLRDNGTPAWQRLQAVRAIELYRNLVLKTNRPALHEIRRVLARIIQQPLGDSLRFSRTLGEPHAIA